MSNPIQNLRLLSWGFHLCYWGLCLFLGSGILFALILALFSGNPKMGEPWLKGFMILLFLLPGLGFLGDLVGRVLCTFVPLSWTTPRRLSACSLGLYGFQIVLILVLNLEAPGDREKALYYSIGAGLAGCLSLILLVETIRRLARELQNERLFYHAVAMLVLWGVLAAVLISFAILVLLQSSFPVLVRTLTPLFVFGGGILAFGCLIWYGNLLAYTARALGEKVRALESITGPGQLVLEMSRENQPGDREQG